MTNGQWELEELKAVLEPEEGTQRSVSCRWKHGGLGPMGELGACSRPGLSGLLRPGLLSAMVFAENILNSLVLNTMKKTIFCFENGNKRTKMPSSAVRYPSWSMTFLPAIRLECHGCCTALSLVASKICHSIWNCQVYRSIKRMWGFTSHIISVYGVLYPLNSSTASEEFWSHCTI